MAIEIKVFNNLTRKKEVFKPVEEDKVKFYSCGPTTYDFLHVGNARALVVGDLINRVFSALGYDVTFVRNFTDVDDKIIDRAREKNVDPLEHSAQYVDECIEDMNSLRMRPATHTPKVSETMNEIIEMVETLIKKEAAYVVEGEVFYNVPKFKEYGKLSKKDLDSLQHGVRIEVDSKKQNPADFVLWKPAKEGEPSWDSPWGKGRPGWHIECSAMAKKFLGSTIDIHHGGIDLMFPHHENEIAQSEAANGQIFSKHWCHNEFLNFGTEKMSKSLGNVITIRSFVEKFGGEVLRQILSSAHYRSQMEWSEDVVERAICDVERIHEFIKGFHLLKTSESGIGADFLDEIKKIVPTMKSELANDFNIPGSISHFFSLIRLVNREFISKKNEIHPEVYKEIENIIDFTSLATGLVHEDYEEVLARIQNARKALSGNESCLSDSDIEKLIQDRKAARAGKNWAKADEVRDKLQKAGVILKDNPDGTVSWSYK